MTAKPVVCIGVCTLGRPGMLANCLASLAAQQGIGGLDVHLVVADNDVGPSSQRVVGDAVPHVPYPVHYAHEPRRGIPMARNRVLEEALMLGADWLAFIDDDQRASPMWLAKHLEAARRHGADAVQPHIVALYPEPAPFWSIGVNTDPAAPLNDNPNEGRIQKSAGTCGVMFSTRLIRPDGMGLRFDERLALAGGEDAAFFHAAHRQGAKIVWSQMPVVTEEVSRSRLTYSRYVMRGLARGGQVCAQYKRDNGAFKTWKKYLGASLVRLLRGSGQLAIAPVFLPFSMRRFKFTALEGGRNICVAAGAIGGLFSLQYDYYRTIDGY